MFEENSVREITWLSWHHRFWNVPFWKCFPSTIKGRVPFSNPSLLFDKVRFRDGLDRKEGLIIEIYPEPKGFSLLFPRMRQPRETDSCSPLRGYLMNQEKSQGPGPVGEMKLPFQIVVMHVFVRYDIHDTRISAATEIQPTTSLLGNFSPVSFSKTRGPNPWWHHPVSFRFSCHTLSKKMAACWSKSSK